MVSVRTLYVFVALIVCAALLIAYVTMSCPTATCEKTRVVRNRDEVARRDADVSQAYVRRAAGADSCGCGPPDTLDTDGTWVGDSWTPADNSTLDYPAVSSVLEVVAKLRAARRETDRRPVRILFVGDSISRYLMCHLSRAIAAELAIVGLAACDPREGRLTSFRLWPPAQWRERSPVMLCYVKDIYFPETHAVQNLALLEQEEFSMMAEPAVVFVSRGTWDVWARVARDTLAAQLFREFSAGLWYLRNTYPNAEVVVHGMSFQHPATPLAARCAVAVVPQIRNLIYCSAQHVNSMLRVSPLLTPVRYIDFYNMTMTDLNWRSNTFHGDGSHYVGPHSQWAASHVWRLLALLADRLPAEHQNLTRVTPAAMSLDNCQGALFGSMNNDTGTSPKHCSLWVKQTSARLSFRRRLGRNYTAAMRLFSCMAYSRASGEIFGLVDPNWASQYAMERLRESADNDTSPFRQLFAAVQPLHAHLWIKWKGYSEYCASIERQLNTSVVTEIDSSVRSRKASCVPRLVLTLRSDTATRRRLNLPPVVIQDCQE